MRCAIYTRVSTLDQESENQLRQLRDFVENRGWQVVNEFSDAGISGKTADRPSFRAMFTAASKRQFDVLVFWSLDRLSREGCLETLQHLQRLTNYGIAWRSFTEQYLDSTGIFREAIISVIAAIAKQERVRLSERTKAGLARVRAKGIRLGRPSVPVDLPAVRDRISRGDSVRSIARALGVSAAVIGSRLRQPA